MKKLISTVLLMGLLISPILANDFTLVKHKPRIKATPNHIFNLLQFTGVVLVNADLVVTYHSIWSSRGRIGEANPIWRGTLKNPPLMFVAYSLINIGVIIGINWLYKKNRTLAWVFVIAVNAMQIYCVYGHLRLQRKIGI